MAIFDVPTVCFRFNSGHLLLPIVLPVTLVPVAFTELGHLAAL